MNLLLADRFERKHTNVEIREEMAFSGTCHFLSRTAFGPAAHETIRMTRWTYLYEIEHRKTCSETAGRANLRKSEGETK